MFIHEQTNQTISIDLCHYEAEINGNILVIENFLNDVPKDEEKTYFDYGKICFDENVIEIEKDDDETDWIEIIDYILRYYESIGFEFLMTYKRYHND